MEVTGEVSKGNEAHVIEHCRKGDTCHKVAENLTELYSTIMLKAESVSNKFGYLARIFPSMVWKIWSFYVMILLKCKWQEVY